MELAITQRSYLHRRSALSRASSRQSGCKRLLSSNDRSRTRFCPTTRATTVLGLPNFASRRGAVASLGWSNSGQLSVVTRPRRLTGTFRTTPSGSLPRVSGVRWPCVPSGLRAPRPLCRSTSRQEFVHEMPNAEARGYVRRRRTQPAGGRW